MTLPTLPKQLNLLDGDSFNTDKEEIDEPNREDY